MSILHPEKEPVKQTFTQSFIHRKQKVCLHSSGRPVGNLGAYKNNFLLRKRTNITITSTNSSTKTIYNNKKINRKSNLLIKIANQKTTPRHITHVVA